MKIAYAMRYVATVACSMVPLAFLNFKCDMNYAGSVELSARQAYVAEVEPATVSQSVDDAWEQVYARGGRRDVRARRAFEDLLDRDGDGTVSEGELERGINEVFSPTSPVGKLWLSYAGPDALSHSERELERHLAGYRHWRPVVRYLLDSSGDGRISERERREAVYKVIHQ